ISGNPTPRPGATWAPDLYKHLDNVLITFTLQIRPDLHEQAKQTGRNITSQRVTSSSRWLMTVVSSNTLNSPETSMEQVSNPYRKSQKRDGGASWTLMLRYD